MKNIVANLISSFWNLLVLMVCVPLYIRFLGVEGYGLIGFFIMLQMLLQIFDLGLTPTMNRMMARYSVNPGLLRESRNFVRTLEIVYMLIGCSIGAVIFLASPFIARHWLKAGDLSMASVSGSIQLMGLLATFQWMINFYTSGLMGLQRQVTAAVVLIVSVTASHALAVFFLWKTEPSVPTFFLCHLMVAVARFAAVYLFFWTALPASEHTPVFGFSHIRKVMRFSMGMGGIAIVGLLLSQIDKVILSKLVDLKVFGYYTLASTVAMTAPTVLVIPVYNAMLPRFSALVAVGDEDELVASYHRGCQLIASFMMPLAGALILFSREIMFLWTGNPEVATNTAPIISLLAAGSAVNAVMSLPMGAQVAYGWTSLTLVANMIIMCVIVPGVFFLAKFFGAAGAASSWIILNVMYLLIVIPVMHNRILKGERMRWIREDVVLPLSVSLVLIMGWRLFIPPPRTALPSFSYFVVMLTSTIAATVLAAPVLRRELKLLLERIKR